MTQSVLQRNVTMGKKRNPNHSLYPTLTEKEKKYQQILTEKKKLEISRSSLGHFHSYFGRI